MSIFKCEHCKNEFDENAAILNEFGQKFCCNGCKNVFSFLKSNGFDEFYERLGKQKHIKAGFKDINEQTTQSFFKNYVNQNGDICDIYLIIEGVHCSACVWLNEKILAQSDGILEANINAATNKAHISWDNSVISLLEILQKIQSIGYNPLPYDPNKAEIRANDKRREFYIKMLVGIFCLMNIMWIAIALYSGYFSGMDSKVKDILHFAEFILASPVLFYTGSEFFKSAWYSFKNRLISMDLSVCVGASITYFYSVWAMLNKNGEVYFDSVVMIITFVFAGKFLEILSKKRAVDNLDALTGLISSEIYVLNNDKFDLKSVHEVKQNDIIMTRSGEKTLIDGIIIDGLGSFDYSSLNGESLPVTLKKGDEILSGAICLDGTITYKAKTSYKGSILGKIISLLENASFKKPKIERLANKIAGKFSISILILAILTFCVWLNYTHLANAVIIAVSVLIISCPCALSLATPVATLVGLGTALKNGIIFKEARLLEDLSKCKCVIFDKTGTLTKGKLKVVKAQKFKDFDDNLLYSLLNASTHPISVALQDFVDANLVGLNEVKNILGYGVSAKCGELRLKGGSAQFVGVLAEQNYNSVYYFSINDEIVAKYELEDEIKHEAKIVINELKKSNYKVVILTGDHEEIAKKVALELGIDEYYADVNPIQKSKIVNELNKKFPCVMIGDGINDLIALKSANIGICMGSGASISVENSDVVLLKDDLKSLLLALNLSKYTFFTIKQNLVFSLVYNITAIPLAIFGFVIPLFAAILMSFSSLIVVLNSAKIKIKFSNKASNE